MDIILAQQQILDLAPDAPMLAMRMDTALASFRTMIEKAIAEEHCRIMKTAILFSRPVHRQSWAGVIRGGRGSAGGCGRACSHGCAGHTGRLARGGARFRRQALQESCLGLFALHARLCARAGIGRRRSRRARRRCAVRGLLSARHGGLPAVGKRKARPFGRCRRLVDTVLKGTGFPMAKIDAVRGAIRTHMYYRDPVGPEALYLHDADALDWLGAIGVADHGAGRPERRKSRRPQGGEDARGQSEKRPGARALARRAGAGAGAARPSSKRFSRT